MKNPTITIVNCDTDETIVREMTDDEYAELLNQQNESAKNKAEQEAAQTAAKASAQAKLEALGLTADDLKALGL